MNENKELMARYEADKQAFAKRLNEALDDLGWPQRGRPGKIRAHLREKISEIAIRKWLVADSIPEMKRLGEISRITGKSVQWLLTGRGDGESNVSEVDMPAVREVPLISWVSAGTLCNTGDLVPVEMVEEWYPCPAKCSNRAYALKVKGNSMTSPYPGTKSYPEGSVIFVDPEVEALPGKRVIARVGDETTFKELVEDAGVKFLQPINPQYPNIPITRDVHICGVVVGSYIPE